MEEVETEIFKINKIIIINKFRKKQKMNKVYPFTNENVASFNSIYDFSNAEVLSVLGSGDQCFSSMLFGAKEIELYDCNDLAWDFLY